MFFLLSPPVSGQQKGIVDSLNCILSNILVGTLLVFSNNSFNIIYHCNAEFCPSKKQEEQVFCTGQGHWSFPNMYERVNNFETESVVDLLWMKRCQLEIVLQSYPTHGFNISCEAIM